MKTLQTTDSRGLTRSALAFLQEGGPRIFMAIDYSNMDRDIGDDVGLIYEAMDRDNMSYEEMEEHMITALQSKGWELVEFPHTVYADWDFQG